MKDSGEINFSETSEFILNIYFDELFKEFIKSFIKDLSQDGIDQKKLFTSVDFLYKAANFSKTEFQGFLDNVFVPEEMRDEGNQNSYTELKKLSIHCNQYEIDSVTGKIRDLFNQIKTVQPCGDELLAEKIPQYFKKMVNSYLKENYQEFYQICSGVIDVIKSDEEDLMMTASSSEIIVPAPIKKDNKRKLSYADALENLQVEVLADKIEQITSLESEAPSTSVVKAFGSSSSVFTKRKSIAK